jgi:hypothetical protein
VTGALPLNTDVLPTPAHRRVGAQIIAATLDLDTSPGARENYVFQSMRHSMRDILVNVILPLSLFSLLLWTQTADDAVFRGF